MFNCPICEYKKIKNNRLSAGDFVEKKWIENYFPSLNLDFAKIPKQKKKKTPDGYILHNQQKIALAEIKFLKCSKRELKSGEYSPIEIFNERLSNKIPQAKKQLETIQDFNGPKVIYFITESHEAYPQSFKDAILSVQCIKIDEGNNIFYNGPISFLPKEDLKKEDPNAKDWNRFADGFLSAIFCFCCNPFHRHEMWLFENEKADYALPVQLKDKECLSWHAIYKR